VHGAGLRERQSGTQSQAIGARIGGDDLLHIAALAGNDQRARIRLALPREAVGRDPSQPEADDPLP
jgi:hypothetical protein